MDSPLQDDVTSGELLYEAWSIMANASDWIMIMKTEKSAGWCEAAERWHDRYHAWIDDEAG